MTIILTLLFLVWIFLVLWRMCSDGKITGFMPQTRQDRLRLYWLVIGTVNFLAFIIHAISDGTCAFPSGGRLVGEHYLVTSHGRDISFTPTGYAFSFWHGVVFVVIFVVCMFAVWRLRKTERPAAANC